MRVVITGGGGFLGRQLCKRLLGVGELTLADGSRSAIQEITLFDRGIDTEAMDSLWSHFQSPHHSLPSVRCVSGSIEEESSVQAALGSDSNLSVFHLASMVSGECEDQFDEAWRVNVLGMRLLLDTLCKVGGNPKVVFSSSIACFGGELPAPCDDRTKHTPQTTYGMTKVIGELMINDYSRKGYIDGRSARLPTVIIRPGKPNTAASSWASGMFREPLKQEVCLLPVDWDQPHPMTGYRTVIDSLIALHEVPQAVLGHDRAIGLPARCVTPRMAKEALQRFAAETGVVLGEIQESPDARIQSIVRQWPKQVDGARGIAIGLPDAPSLSEIIHDYIVDFGNQALP
jgi:nucleoside-diphosphate-sugar epimerase